MEKNKIERLESLCRQLPVLNLDSSLQFLGGDSSKFTNAVLKIFYDDYIEKHKGKFYYDILIELCSKSNNFIFKTEEDLQNLTFNSEDEDDMYLFSILCRDSYDVNIDSLESFEASLSNVDAFFEEDILADIYKDVRMDAAYLQKTSEQRSKRFNNLCNYLSDFFGIDIVDRNDIVNIMDDIDMYLPMFYDPFNGIAYLSMGIKSELLEYLAQMGYAGLVNVLKNPFLAASSEYGYVQENSICGYNIISGSAHPDENTYFFGNCFNPFFIPAVDAALTIYKAA